MTPKTAEIISRVAAWRDRGISKETVRCTLLAQYVFTSLREAARALKLESDTPAEAIVDRMYERKMEKTA